jgi:hypothetical protein
MIHLNLEFMHKILYLFFVITFISSCSTQAPKENDVKNIVRLWYEQQNTGDGAGRWDVEGVTVLSISKDAKRKNVFITTSLVTGTRKLPPLAESRPDEKFSDSLRMDLEWNGAKWTTANQ